MGMSQPAVSQLIANFEEALGAPLFVRRNGAIYPTSRAETLLDDALDLLSLIDRMEMRMALKTDRPLSHLRISATLSFISEVLPRVIAEMRAAEPELSCSVASHAVDEMTQAVAEGQIDFAFHTRAAGTSRHRQHPPKRPAPGLHHARRPPAGGKDPAGGGRPGRQCLHHAVAPRSLLPLLPRAVRPPPGQLHRRPFRRPSPASPSKWPGC